VTARALAPLEVVAEYAAPLLAVGGTLVAWRGRRDADAEALAARAADQLGLEPGEIVQVQPFPGAKNRYLHLMSKVTETPLGFPRRPGMATKRPLGRNVVPGI
jgi:16S rRNA (guanine527-N7)-methyltransferase